MVYIMKSFYPNPKSFIQIGSSDDYEVLLQFLEMILDNKWW